MKLDDFEKRQLTQINKLDKQLNEGWGSNLIARFFSKSIKKDLKKMQADIEDLPELKATLDSIERLGDDVEQTLARAKDAHKRGLMALQKSGDTKKNIEIQNKEWKKYLEKYQRTNRRNRC